LRCITSVASIIQTTIIRKGSEDTQIENKGELGAKKRAILMTPKIAPKLTFKHFIGKLDYGNKSLIV
jgi:hypothetical protein